jgi:hypothetical protein
MTRARTLKGVERTSVADELAELYEQGATVRSLAARTGRSYGGVHSLLRAAGVTLRGRGGKMPKAGA